MADESRERLARERVDALSRQYEAVNGEISPAAQTLLDAFHRLELLRLEADESLESKGLKDTYYNGRQTLTRENKAFTQLCKAVAAQTKLMQALKLLPGGRRAAHENDEDEDGDDEAAGGDINDY